MAIMKNIVAGKYRGNAGAFRFALKDGQNVVTERVYTNKSKGDGATIEQRSQRCKITNVVNFFKALAPVQRKAWENKPRNMSDYNMFVKKNMARNPYLLPKDLVEAGFFVPFDAQISQGSLVSPFVQNPAYGFTCPLVLNEGKTIANITVKEFSDAMVASNPSLSYGDQLTFVHLSEGTPVGLDYEASIRTVVKISEITLSSADNETLFLTAMPNLNGVVGASANSFSSVSDTPVAVIVSRLAHGKLKCSTVSFGSTSLLVDKVCEAATTPEFQKAARESYGVQDVVLLTPNL